MIDKEKAIKELKEVLDNLDITNKYRLNLIRAIEYLQEEPVSKDLKKAANNALEGLLDKYDLVGTGSCLEMFKLGAKWQKEQDQYTIELAEDHAMLAGMEKMKEEMMKDIWKPADGDDLPEIDREVVVFTQNFPDDAGIMSVSIAHRPNPNGWDGKSLASGKVEHYTPKTYGKGGWNIPDIKLWLDVELPKEIEL